MTIITEIYVSIDNLTFTKLDLYKDESVSLKLSKKDLQDITKVFAPFSQNFSIPATDKNKTALDFFGNTELQKTIVENKLKCKIYTNGILNQQGILKIEGVKYKNDKADSFTASFNTEFLSLKDRIGDDTIDNLSTNNQISWKADNVFNRLKSTSIVNDIRYYVPLWSNNRVWSRVDDEDSANNIDNIVYNVSNNPNKDRVINIDELRPSIDMLSIINLIKNKYELNIDIPLSTKDELKEVFVWCNGNNLANLQSKKLIINKQFNSDKPLLGNAVANFTDSSVKITKNSVVNFCEFGIKLKDLVCGDENSTATITIDFVRKSDNVSVISYDIEVKNGDNDFRPDIPLVFFDGNEFEFFVYFRVSKPIFWKSMDTRIFYRAPFTSPSLATTATSSYTNSINSDATGCHLANLITSLPNVKVIDFLTSFLKTFNLSIYDSSPSDENLLFLSPEDIETPNKIYSKLENDYTLYADKKEVPKSVNNPYNYYNFKHKTSNYRSNRDFKKQFNVEYGQIYYPLVKPTKPNEFKVETEFSIVPPIYINGSQIYTSYGFTSENPSIVDNDKVRYSPNLDELTLMYYHGAETIPALSCQNVSGSDVLINSSLTQCIKSMPYCKQNNNSLAFSVLRIENVDYIKNLYSLYYSKFIGRLLNINALSQIYTLNLPSNEIYINDAEPLRPKGFRLQNDIVIGETRFETLEANIDVTTGKTKLTLLNY